MSNGSHNKTMKHTQFTQQNNTTHTNISQSRNSNTIRHNATHTESNKITHLLKLTKTQTYTVTLTDTNLHTT